jgi:hypothetical protein
MADSSAELPTGLSAPILTRRWVFPRWVNYALPATIIGVLGGIVYMPVLFALGASPKTTAVGYAPEQPVPYSHAVHAGKLGIDCRYCHSTVESTAFAAIPPTQTCMNCHLVVRKGSANIVPLEESWETGMPVQWVKVHDLPDYVYFNHSAHVNHGVGCASCHGRVDEMDVVYQAQKLSMDWCLDCHRAPEKFLRPKDQVTNMRYRAAEHPYAKEKNLTRESAAQLEVGGRLKQEYGIRDRQYMQSCYTCHR